MSMPSNRENNDFNEGIRLERTFPRFTIGQRWEHAILLLSITILLLTGLVQKYRTTAWSHNILSTPERLEMVQNIHHLAALLLTAEVVYHIGRALYLLSRRKLPGKIFITWQDVRDGFQMIKYLTFLSRKKPEFGKFNFEQKVTYWFIFFSIGIMILSGFIIWFPIFYTKFLPGAIVPAAKLAHSTEAVVAGIFIVVWHLYHVLIERLNLSIFTGRLSESEMIANHKIEYESLMIQGKPETSSSKGGER